MYNILAWGAFTAGLVPLVAKPILPVAAKAFDHLDMGYFGRVLCRRPDSLQYPNNFTRDYFAFCDSTGD